MAGADRLAAVTTSPSVTERFGMAPPPSGLALLGKRLRL